MTLSDYKAIMRGRKFAVVQELYDFDGKFIRLKVLNRFQTMDGLKSYCEKNRYFSTAETQFKTDIRIFHNEMVGYWDEYKGLNASCLIESYNHD